MKHALFGALAALGVVSFSMVDAGDAAARDGGDRFDLASLKGSYAGIFSGKINTASGLLPILGTGLFVADGEGGLTGHETYTVVTTPCEATISGSYTIHADGTGTNAVTFTTASPGCVSGTYTQGLVIARRGLVLLSNTNGDQINEEWHRQR